MIKKSLLLIITVIVISCAKQPETQQLTQTRKMPNFNKIHVVGKMDMRVNTKSSRSSVVVSGDERDLAHIHTSVKEGMLNVTSDGNYPKHGKINLQVNTKYLNLLAYDGHGHLRVSNINSRHFEADITNDGSVKLSGNIGLRKLRLSGKGTTQVSGVNTRDLTIEMIGSPKAIIKGYANIKKLKYGGGAGFLNLYWVNSREMTINGSGYATVQLAGKVDELHLDLTEDAVFKGRYLRVKQGFIKTHGRSKAEVQVLNKQHALAKDMSNIYFYNAAHMQTDLMADNGSVLDMQQGHRFATTHFEGYHPQG